MGIEQIGITAGAYSGTANALPQAGGRLPAPPTAASAPSAGERAQPAAVLPGQLQQAVKMVNKFIEPVAQDLEFSIDKETGKSVVRVIDTETHQVLRQIPEEEMLAIARALDRLQGLLIKQKA